jgi:hypothetical protein
VKDDLTQPERFAERALEQERKDAIREIGGCAVCTNRSGSRFAGAHCRVPGQRFPLCMDSPDVTFQLDGPALDRIIRARKVA